MVLWFLEIQKPALVEPNSCYLRPALILTNLSAGIGKQLLVPKPPNHIKEQDVKRVKKGDGVSEDLEA